jgi:hypothetical protein
MLNTEMLYTGVFFLFILISGFWVSRSGKPYHSGIFNLHKLIGLGAGVFLIHTVYRAHQAAPLSPAQWSAIGLTAFFFIVTVVAGGLLSVLAEGGLKNIGVSTQNAISLVHKFFPYVIIVATGGTLYLLL